MFELSSIWVKIMRIVFTFISLIFFASTAFNQNIKNDLSFIEKKEYSFVLKDNNYRSENNVNNKKPIIYRHKSVISRFNPLSLTATVAMLFYQYIASPQFFRYCLYHRSCSNFSKQAIEEFGLIKGVFLSADRLMRCNVAAIQDFPPKDISSEGLIFDEPSKYRLKKQK